jgi:hypothetical protein
MQSQRLVEIERRRHRYLITVDCANAGPGRAARTDDYR